MAFLLVSPVFPSIHPWMLHPLAPPQLDWADQHLLSILFRWRKLGPWIESANVETSVSTIKGPLDVVIHGCRDSLMIHWWFFVYWHPFLMKGVGWWWVDGFRNYLFLQSSKKKHTHLTWWKRERWSHGLGALEGSNRRKNGVAWEAFGTSNSMAASRTLDL